MSDCSSLANVLAAIDKAIAEYSFLDNNGYTDYWKKQIDQYNRQTDFINRQMDDLIKERVRNNGGYTGGVRG
jgi:hypothetical protein